MSKSLDDEDSFTTPLTDMAGKAAFKTEFMSEFMTYCVVLLSLPFSVSRYFLLVKVFEKRSNCVCHADITHVRTTNEWKLTSIVYKFIRRNSVTIKRKRNKFSNIALHNHWKSFHLFLCSVLNWKMKCIYLFLTVSFGHVVRATNTCTPLATIAILLKTK